MGTEIFIIICGVNGLITTLLGLIIYTFYLQSRRMLAFTALFTITASMTVVFSIATMIRGTIITKGEEKEFCSNLGSNVTEIHREVTTYSNADIHLYIILYLFIASLFISWGLTMFWRLYLQPKMTQLEILRRTTIEINY